MPFSPLFWFLRVPLIDVIDYRKKSGTLSLTSLLEDPPPTPSDPLARQAAPDAAVRAVGAPGALRGGHREAGSVPSSFGRRPWC